MALIITTCEANCSGALGSPYPLPITKKTQKKKSHKFCEIFHQKPSPISIFWKTI